MFHINWFSFESFFQNKKNLNIRIYNMAPPVINAILSVLKISRLIGIHFE